MARQRRPEALQAALEGASPLEDDPELWELVALARRLPVVAPGGPGPAVTTRLRERLNATLDEGLTERATGWLKSWVGAGAIPRPLTQRLAAGFLLLGAVGSGAAGATGSNPVDWASDAGDFGLSVIRNLGPGSGGEGSGVPTPEPDVTLTATPETITPGAEPPSSTATAEASPAATPDDDDEDDDDLDEDSDDRDNSGPGSANSGRDEDDDPEDER